MKDCITSPLRALRLFLLFAVLIAPISGCLPLDGDQGAGDAGHAAANPAPGAAVSNEPYYPSDFRDLMVPGELEWNREKSVTINTDSFTGGILNFGGRVEVNSLTEFFINAMKKDGWTAIGTIKAKNVLLAFSKANGSCMIRIDEGGTLGKTEVNIYITHKNN